MYPRTYACSPEEFLASSRLPIRVMEDEAAMMEDIAQAMFEAILAKPRAGRTVLICPVGPVAQYPLLAAKLNAAFTDLSHVWFINMDEYLGPDGRYTQDRNLSFHQAMEAQFYSRLLPQLRPPADHCLFPDPHDPGALDALLDGLGGADLSCTGVGINGHLAFNEPPCADEDITDEAFARLPSRVLPISAATLINNGGRKIRGALDLFPRQCVTIGMRQLMQCRRIKIYLYCDWQWGVMRKLALEPPSRLCPASFLQLHPDAELVVSRDLYQFTLQP